MTVIKSKKQRQSGKRKTLKRKSNKSQKGGMRPPKIPGGPSQSTQIRPGMQQIKNPTKYDSGLLTPPGSWRKVEPVRRGKTGNQMYGLGSKYSRRIMQSVSQAQQAPQAPKAPKATLNAPPPKTRFKFF